MISTPSRLLVAAACLPLLFGSLVRADELIIDGGFEFASGIPEWELSESIYDQTSMTRRDFGGVNSAQQQGFGPQSGNLALWLRAFVGGATPGPDTLTNARLTQTASGAEGETYNFTGWSRFEFLYSGGVETLDSGGPLGASPSPTANTLELAFLDASGQAIGAPLTLDVKADRTIQSGGPGFNDWVQHSLSGVAPAGTVSVRVTADAEQMLWNSGQPNESAFYDNFSLTTESDSQTELLLNSDLEDPPTPFDPAFVITEDPGGSFTPPGATVQSAGFANRPDSGGQLGAWLRSFEGTTADPAGATLSQVSAALAGGDYTFSLWSNFQPNYSGGTDDFGTETMAEIAFLDASGGEIGTPTTLDLRADREAQSGGAANTGAWVEHSLTATAPSGAEAVRVLVDASGMVANPAGGQQSAFLDDFSLIGPVIGGGLAGDYNADGTVDAADYTIWRDNLGTAGPAGDGTGPDLLGVPDGIVDVSDYQFWRDNFGATAASAAQASAAPEPLAVSLTLLAATGCLAVAGRLRLRHRSACNSQ